MHRSRLWRVAISAAVLWASHSAVASADEPHGHIAVINFQDLHTLHNGFHPCPTPEPGSPCDPTGDLAGPLPTYSKHGYTFTYTPAPGEPFPTGLFVAGRFWPWNDGTHSLFANSDNALTTLKRDDGRPFTLAAMDLAELNGGRSDLPAVVVFQGVTATGGAVSVEIALDNTTGFQQVYFPSEFRNLLWVQWQQGDNVTNNPHMFDNVVLSTAE
jgi:hypothetical protein